MANSRQPRNPFSIIAVAIGLLFTLTACELGVMMVRGNRGVAAPTGNESGAQLMDMLDRHCTAILAGELAALGLFTIAAIYLDHVRGMRQWRDRQSAAASAEVHPAPMPLGDSATTRGEPNNKELTP